MDNSGSLSSRNTAEPLLPGCVAKVPGERVVACTNTVGRPPHAHTNVNAHAVVQHTSNSSSDRHAGVSALKGAADICCISWYLTPGLILTASHTQHTEMLSLTAAGNS